MSLDKLAKLLSEQSGYKRQALISREVFESQLFSHSKVLTDYLWRHFSPKPGTVETISEDAFVRGSEKIYSTITDKDQLQFYLKLFSNGNEMMVQSSFMDFLNCAYAMYKIQYKIKCAEDDGADKTPAALSWMDAVFKSAFHIKTEMSIFFLSTWISTNLPRIVGPIHKYITNQLTTSYNLIKAGNKPGNAAAQVIANLKISETNGVGTSEECQSEFADPTTTLIHPIAMWLLRSSLPGKFLTVLEKKPDVAVPRQSSAFTTPQQLMEMLSREKPVTESWALLYDSDDQGLSINRFQHHVFNYRGPTLMFVKADNDYLFCIASDIEWRESCHFWGTEESVLLMLKPEFKIVERGSKLLYANFSIRGYPFGIQVGKNPKNLSIEIKPEFNYVSYKQIPCKIIRLIAWGCAPPEVKVSQADLRKWEAKQAEKNRKVNLNNPEWKENPDKYLLELAGTYRSYDN